MMENAEVRTMELPVKLSPAELSLRAQELASAEHVMGDAEQRLEQFIESAKETKKGIENEVGAARAVIARLARIVRDRSEERAVPVMDEADYEAGAMNTYRTDTHEIVSTRGLTHEERQRSLFDAKAKKKPS